MFVNLLGSYVMVCLVLYLQTMSFWKVINADREDACLVRAGHPSRRSFAFGDPYVLCQAIFMARVFEEAAAVLPLWKE